MAETEQSHQADTNYPELMNNASGEGYLITHPDSTTETVSSVHEEREARKKWHESNRGH